MLHARTIYCTLAAFLIGSILLGCSSSSNEEAIKAQHVRAQELMEKQQFPEALSAYQQIVQLDPKDDEAYYQLALLSLRSGKPEDINSAHQALLKVVKLNSSRVDAHAQLARLYLALGETAKARLHAEAILSAKPGHSEGHLIKGESYVREGKFESAITEILQAIDADPKSLAARLELARTHALMHNFSDAEAVLRHIMQTDPQSVESRIALGDVLLAVGKESEAVKEYRDGLEVDRKSGVLYARLAGLSQKQGRTGEAEEYYRHWIEALPNDVNAHIALALFYRSTGRLKEAEASYQQAKQVEPSSHAAQEALVTFYLETNRLKEAGLGIDAILKKDSADIPGRILKARLMLQQGELDKGTALLQELQKQVPKSAVVQHYLGIAWLLQQDLPQALSALKEARTLAPNSSEIRTSLGQAYLAQGSLSLAIKEGTEAIGLNPQNVSALKLVAEVCRQVGITERTFSTWKREFAGLSLSELRELRQLWEENTKLKRLVADLSLDRHMRQEIVRKTL